MNQPELNYASKLIRTLKHVIREKAEKDAFVDKAGNVSFVVSDIIREARLDINTELELNQLLSTLWAEIEQQEAAKAYQKWAEQQKEKQLEAIEFPIT